MNDYPREVAEAVESYRASSGKCNQPIGTECRTCPDYQRCKAAVRRVSGAIQTQGPR